MAQKYCPECNINIKVFYNFEEARKRNKERDRVVPDDVMDRMVKQFEYPDENQTTLKFKLILALITSLPWKSLSINHEV